MSDKLYKIGLAICASNYERHRNIIQAVHRALAEKVHETGARFGIAVNPLTPVEELEPHLAYLDTVTLMLVHPGFAGAKMVEGIMDKVRECMARMLKT